MITRFCSCLIKFWKETRHLGTDLSGEKRELGAGPVADRTFPCLRLGNMVQSYLGFFVFSRTLRNILVLHILVRTSCFVLGGAQPRTVSPFLLQLFSRRYPIYQKVDHCRHACSTKCKFSESEKAIETYCKVVHSPLVLPLLFGWWRELKRNPRAVPEDEGRVLYTSPCGVPIRNEEKLLDYLAKVESVLPTQVFSFEPAIELTNRFVVYKSRVIYENLSSLVQIHP